MKGVEESQLSADSSLEVHDKYPVDLGGLASLEPITRKIVAEKLAAHLRHELSLDSLVA